jgi:hypothetical protein
MRYWQIALLLLTLVPQYITCQDHASKNQTFGEENLGSMEAVRIPNSVVDALIASKEAAAGRSWARNNPGKDLNLLFKAFPVSLSGSREKDYVVWGQQPLSGADNDWFWVVQTTSPKPRVVLFCGALTLEMVHQVHNSLRDIRCAWESPGGDGFIQDYRFNGQRYVLSKKTETHRRRP